jgi:hypothetical protein
MKKNSNFKYGLWFLAMLLCSSVLLPYVAVAKDLPIDAAPVVTIEAPSPGGGSYVTDQGSINLSGYVDDAAGVRAVTWSNDRGGSGTAQGAINSWTGPWRWIAKGISLSEGENIITVTVVNRAGISDTSTLTVIYDAPSLPSVIKVLNNKQAKFTFYFGGPDYDGLDRFSDVGYLLKGATEPFVLPFNKNVTVTATVEDPRNPSNDLQIFTQTIPAGKVPVSSKYRYVSGPRGIRELTLQPSTSTSIYMYIFVQNWDFLPALKASMSTAQYQAFVKSIRSFTITLQIEDVAWVGEAPLKIGTYSTHKQELVYNR